MKLFKARRRVHASRNNCRLTDARHQPTAAWLVVAAGHPESIRPSENVHLKFIGQ